MVSDILGIGEWQAARVNERSEVLNELNKPFFSTTYRTKNGISTVELTPVHVLFAVMLYYLVADLAPWFKDMLENVFGSPQDNPGDYTAPNVSKSYALEQLLNPLSLLAGGLTGFATKEAAMQSGEYLGRLTGRGYSELFQIFNDPEVEKALAEKGTTKAGAKKIGAAVTRALEAVKG